MPMSGSCLLDTNVVIALLNGSLSTQRPHDTLFLSAIVLGELYFGAYKSSRADENIAAIQRLASEFRARNGVLGCTEETSRHYGQIKSALRKKGRPIPENDIWLAATSIEHGLILVSRDYHFDHIPEVAKEVW